MSSNFSSFLLTKSLTSFRMASIPVNMAKRFSAEDTIHCFWESEVICCVQWNCGRSCFSCWKVIVGAWCCVRQRIVRDGYSCLVDADFVDFQSGFFEVGFFEFASMNLLVEKLWTKNEELLGSRYLILEFMSLVLSWIVIKYGAYWD